MGMTTTEALMVISSEGVYSFEEEKAIREDSLEAVMNMGGDYSEYARWNRILAFLGLGSIR